MRKSARFPGFPTFAPMFDEGPARVGRYLTLLNLGDGASEAVTRAKRCVDASPDAASEIEAVFDAVGWREHLVGAVALLATSADHRPLESLWRRVRLGSWTSPQLAATLSLADHRFAPRATALLESFASEPGDHPMRPPSAEEAVSRHVVIGPGVGREKTAAALVALTGVAPGGAVVELIKQDYDESGGIAVSWRDGIAQVFKQAGLAIPPS